MPGPLQPRVSWAALWDYARRRGITEMGRLSELCGVDVRDLYRYRSAGEVNERAADRIAVGLGDVPENIWGDEYAEATACLIEKAEAEEAAERAAKRADSSRRWQRYLALDPSRQAQHNKRRNAAYWQDRERELARQRAYDRSRKDARRAYRERVRLARLQQMDTAERADNVA